MINEFWILKINVIYPFQENTSSLLWVGAGLSHVGYAEHEGEEHAEGANGDVADGQEVVLATEGVGGADDEGLLALEGLHLVVVLNSQVVITRG